MSKNESTAMKSFCVYLDRPGAGWIEIIKAKTLQQAKKIANKKHSCEPPCDGGYEVKEKSENENRPFGK